MVAGMGVVRKKPHNPLKESEIRKTDTGILEMEWGGLCSTTRKAVSEFIAGHLTGKR